MNFKSYCFLLATVLQSIVVSPVGRPIVNTPQGCVEGTTLSDQVDAFPGIPYAQRPVGPLRFQPPQALSPEHNPNRVINASEYGPVCYQFHYRTVAGYNPVPTTPESEDCLTVNIFVPRNRDHNKLLPVFVWTYGGAFGEGSATVPIYDPPAFVEINKDIIYVPYRVNLFGFPNSPALPAQNLGLRDQRMALEWLRSNIAFFGGDPKHMVMGGHSAGADSVHSMQYAYPDDPIVKGSILESGVIEIAGAATENADSEFERVASTVGCINANRTAELECMMTIDAERLKHAISNRTFNYFGTPAGGTPMVDNVTVFSIDEYIARGSSGQFAKIPTFMGSTAQEADGLLNFDPVQGVNRTFSDTLTLSLFDCNAALEATLRAINNLPIWRWHYDAIFPSATPYSWLRAYHGADLGFVFGTYKTFGNESHTQPYEDAAFQFLQRVYSTFIRDPEAWLTKEFGWPTFNPNTTSLIELFMNNVPNASLADPSIYDAPCVNPPPIPLEDLCPSTVPECNPA